MKQTDTRDSAILLPPILAEYIASMFNDKVNNIHVRQNYRDNIDYIRRVCEEAVQKFDREIVRTSTNRPRKSVIRSAHAE